jgi:hypothetical protein
VVRFATADGTPVSGTDYTAVNPLATIPAGSTSATVNVPVLANTNVNPTDLTFTATISNPVGATTAPPTTETVTLHNINTVGTVTFSAATFTGTEGGNVSVVLNRTGTNLAGNVTATVTPSVNINPAPFEQFPRNAAATDFSNTPQTVTFAAGQTSATVNIATNNNNLVTGQESFTLTLSGAGGTGTAQGRINDANGTAVQQYINGVYVHLLNRIVDQGTPLSGLTTWTNFLGAAFPAKFETATQFVLSVESSTEARMVLTDSLYRQYLGRPAGTAEQANGAAFLATGTLPKNSVQDELTAAIIGSAEFLQLAGGTMVGFEQRTYQTALGRAQTPGEVVNINVNDPAARTSYGLAVMLSLEADQTEIIRTYANDLQLPNFPHSDSGINFWAGFLQQGFADDVVIAMILAAPQAQPLLTIPQ